MKKVIILLLSVFFVHQANAQKKTLNLVFKAGETELTTSQTQEINDLAKTLKDGERLIIYPLTQDTIFDQLVFAKNAPSQADEIVKFAKTIGFEFKTKLMNFPSAYTGWSVGITLLYKQPDAAAIATQSDAKAPTLKNHYPEKPSQYFLVYPNKDTIIIGNEGTKLFFEAGSLLSSQVVQIELKEYYSLQDYMKSDMPTISNGKMIQTGGSIFLNAKENGTESKQVKINPEKGVGVDFTLGKKDSTMQIFIKDPSSPNKMNWVLPSIKKSTNSWEMTETNLGPDGKVISEKKYTSKEAWEQHLKEQELEKKERQKLADRKEEITKATVNKMDSKLKIYNLGYINCDRFPDEPTTPFTIIADAKVIAEYYIIYSDIRGVMKGDIYNKQVNFSSIAKNKTATLVAVSFVDKQAYYFTCSINPSSNKLPNVLLQPVAENFLNQQLSLLK